MQFGEYSIAAIQNFDEVFFVPFTTSLQLFLFGDCSYHPASSAYRNPRLAHSKTKINMSESLSTMGTSKRNVLTKAIRLFNDYKKFFLCVIAHFKGAQA
jgi:hypothetical protein